MLDFFAQIGEVLLAIVDLIVNVVTSLVKFFTMVPSWIAFLVTSVGYLPGIVVSFILVGVFISVILLIVGRN